MSESVVLYIHGKGGSPEESEHYEALFPKHQVVGLDYRADTPWEAGGEIRLAVDQLKERYDGILLIANSIGAFFSMNAGIDERISRAFFISPIVDMEKLIRDMMGWAGVSEAELMQKGRIPTSFGEDLSWEYLCYVREHPVRWTAPTAILYGGRDNLTSRETVSEFAGSHGASLTVMDDGEHWVHTERQLAFLDDWIRKEMHKTAG